MGSPKTRPAVIAHMAKSGGKPVTLEDLVKATGFTVNQIQSQMRNLIKDGQPITVLDKAQMWKWTGDAEPKRERDTSDVSGLIYEGVGRASSGAIIVRDEQGTLFVLKEVQI